MRRLLALSLLVIAAGSGCRMCASPYDYCGPVMDDCCCGSDYQPQVPYQGVSASQEMGEMESSEPVYYEGARSTSSKTAKKSQGGYQNVPTAKLPRQAKTPSRTRSY
jgi:hypothetical protein